MGNDAIFGPIKASVQAVCGKGDEAKDTMKRFKEGNPAVLGVRACYHMAKGGEGERDKGKALGKQGLKNTATIVEGVVNGIPVIGHAKGAYHYRRGNKDRGDSAMKSASRSTAGAMGALAGFAAGNVPGAVAGYLGGVNAADGVTSGVESAVHGKVMLNGNLATCHKAFKDPTVGNVVDAALGVGMDVAAAVAAGAGLGEALTVDAPASSTGTSGIETCGADAPQANLSDSVVVGEDASNVGADTNFDRAAEAVGRMVDGAAESLEEDLKFPEYEVDLGTTVEERIATLENMPTSERVSWATLPDNKRDYVQEID